MRNIGHMDAWEKFRVVDTGDGQVLWRRVGGSGPGKGRENRGNLWGKLENHCFLSSVNLLEIGLNLNWLVDVGGKLYQPIIDYYMD